MPNGFYDANGMFFEVRYYLFVVFQNEKKRKRIKYSKRTQQLKRVYTYRSIENYNEDLLPMKLCFDFLLLRLEKNKTNLIKSKLSQFFSLSIFVKEIVPS